MSELWTREIHTPSHVCRSVVAPGLHGLGPALSEIEGVGRVFVLADAAVASSWGARVCACVQEAGLETQLICVDACEERKDLSTWQALLGQVLGARIGRRDLIVAVGGGVLGDIAGFVAASVLRGVRWVGVPTTLLAMVDSSIGGKTGVNHASVKNGVGAFHLPELVWAAIETLSTLPEHVFREGLSEVLKAALLADAALFEQLALPGFLEQWNDPSVQLQVLARAIAVKASIVERDAHEHGVRAALNLGHTLGHAVESAAGFGHMSHAQAVAIGLVGELRASVRLGWTLDRTLPERTERALVGLGLPVERPADLSQDVLRAALHLDKKADGAMIRLPVVAWAGQFDVRQVPWRVLEEALFTP